MIENATVITPYSWGSPAIELGNRQWRKKILPIGDVEYQGRILHFTRDYLSGLVSAWRDRAYDQVPFQLADAANRHTNDPERTRGQITDLQLGQDDLYAVLDPTERGEQVLADNPYLGVSARIVENYQRSDGKFYPAAIQHVLGTLDPRIPDLGPWQAVEMSNQGGEKVIDMSQWTWQNEPGPGFELAQAAISARLVGLDQLSDQELADLGDTLAEADAEAADDELKDFDAAFESNWAAEQAREQARQYADMEDLIRPARTDEDIMARAISRAQNGIYDTSHVSSFASPGREAIELSTELTMATGHGLCGPPDPFGRCSSPYHQLGCLHDMSTDWQASEPPRSTYEASLSNFADGLALDLAPRAVWGDPDDADQPAYDMPQRTMERAHRFNQEQGLLGDTFDGPNRPQQDSYALAAGEAGYPQPQLPGGYASIRALAKGLNLR